MSDNIINLYFEIVNTFFRKSSTFLKETFAKMLGGSDLTNSGVGGGEVVGEMELAEGAALQLQPTPPAKRAEAYLA